MEELQVIETTSGRQFKPWASREDVQAIEQAVEQAVQDPASVTGVVSEIASGKRAIASAINAKGGSASATESFAELAQDIQDTPTSGVLSSGIVQSEPFSFLDYVCKAGAYPFTEIDDDSVTVINMASAFQQQTQLLKVRMSVLGAISGSGVFQSCSSLQEIDMPNLTTIGGSSVFQSCSSLQEIDMPNLTTISGSSVFQNCAALQEVIMPNLTTISSFNTFTSCSALQRVNLPNLTTISLYATFSKCGQLKEAILPNLSRVGGYGAFADAQNLKNLVLGTLTSFGTSSQLNPNKPNLRNITIGRDTNINLPFHEWTATNVIAEGQTGIDELNANLYNNLLTKLYDHSQDGETRTLRIGWLANVTAENIAYANAKGWTLTT